MHGEAPPPFDGEEAGLATKTMRKIANIGKLGQTWDNLGQLVAVLDIPRAYLILGGIFMCIMISHCFFSSVFSHDAIVFAIFWHTYSTYIQIQSGCGGRNLVLV